MALSVKNQSLVTQVNNYILKLIFQILGKMCISNWRAGKHIDRFITVFWGRQSTMKIIDLFHWKKASCTSIFFKSWCQLTGPSRCQTCITLMRPGCRTGPIPPILNNQHWLSKVGCDIFFSINIEDMGKECNRCQSIS